MARWLFDAFIKVAVVKTIKRMKHKTAMNHEIKRHSDKASLESRRITLFTHPASDTETS